MTHTLPKLPYALDALAPHMSRETMEYHYGKHLQTYVDNLNKLVPGTPFADLTVAQIVERADGPIFNNAAQVYNHTLFFELLSPHPSPMSAGLRAALERDFGSVEKFREQFTAAALALFGSGWVWLAATEKTPGAHNHGKLQIISKSNAGNPLTEGLHPLMVLDVWEHAYYIDHRNRRADFIVQFWEMLDWGKILL